jgi:hypothetical protein
MVASLLPWVRPQARDTWTRLIRQFRQEIFAAAAREGVDLIFTYAGRTAPQLDGIRSLIEPIQVNGGTVLFVQLLCDRDELIARVQTDSRRVRGKLTDPSAVLERYNLALALPFKPHFRVETTLLTATEAAARIAAHYDLPARPAH